MEFKEIIEQHGDVEKYQLIFDKVVNHLAKQRLPAFDGDGCKYRTETEDGDILMCAVGCLIDDQFYRLTMEGDTPTSTPVMQALEDSFKKNGFEMPHDSELFFQFLEELQQHHDSPTDYSEHLNPEQVLEEWAMGFAKAAEAWGLKFDKEVFTQ